MNKTVTIFIFLLLVGTSLLSPLGTIPTSSKPVTEVIDYDPIDTNIVVTVTIKEIRTLDIIDTFTNPDFYVKVFINGKESTSPIWYNTKYVRNPQWSASCIVPHDQEWVSVKIQLWDRNPIGKKLCDISGDYQTGNDQYDINLMYSIKTGHWTGDDYLESDHTYTDPSGYGRLNGCDDGSINQHDRDCELWFDINQTDPDGDGIPYWIEVNDYGTDPTLNDTGRDDDGDGIPIEWEFKWGTITWYDPYSNESGYYFVYWPFEWENFSAMDPDNDGLNNIKEYRTSQWGSDPFRKDIFLELDQMQIGPNGEGNLIPENSKDMLKDAYDKHNIVFHIDDGSMGGGELYPFDENVSWEDIQQIYRDYFLHGDLNNWRRGVFHYGLVTYHCDYYHGFAFPSIIDENHSVLVDCFQISTKEHEVIPFEYPLLRIIGRKSLNKQYHREIIYASAMMHETGHILGIDNGNTPGCDNQTGKFIWQKNWWFWKNYLSVMNYGYMYTFVDYSDGSNGKNDFDDWDRIDLTLFQIPHYYS